MYKAKDIAKVFEEIAPVETGISGDELGFVYGDPETQVTGLACLWNIQVQSRIACPCLRMERRLTLPDNGKQETTISILNVVLSGLKETA